MLDRHHLPFPCHLHFTILEGIEDLSVSWGDLSSSRIDWSSLEFSGEGIIVTTAVRTMGWGGGAASCDGPIVTIFGAGGVLAYM